MGVLRYLMLYSAKDSRFDVDFEIGFGVSMSRESTDGHSPILQFSIFLHFPMCSVDRNPFWGL